MSGSDGKLMEELVEFNRDMDWISHNQEKIRRKHPNKYVAVMKRRIIDVDSELRTLIRRLREKGIDPGEIAIEFISEEPTRLIL